MWLNPGLWHFAASWNMDAPRARWVRPNAFAAKVQEKLTGMVAGLTFVSGPSGHQNPEVVRATVAVPGVSRDTWTADVWVRLAQRTDGERVALAFATALRDAGAGGDWSPETIVRAMVRCENAPSHTVMRDAAIDVAAGAGGIVGNLVRQATASHAFATVCLTAEAYDGGAPEPSTAQGILGRAAAGTVAESNNRERIGETPSVFDVPELRWLKSTELKIGLAVVGGLVVLGVIGYSARGVAQLLRES